MSEVQLEYGAHFEEYIFDWKYKIYLAIGSYGSGKSHNTAMKIILKLLEEKRRCAVIREVFETHLESTYQTLKEVAEIIDPKGKFIKFKLSPLSVEFKNGSKIIFKGMDDTKKMKGLQSVSLVWMEESSEIKYAGYKELLLRLRTRVKSLHIILTTNPVSRDNWVYKHFFKDDEKKKIYVEEEVFYEQRIIRNEEENLYMHHSTVDDNPFVPQSYVDELDKMKEYDPDLWRVARKGFFGVLGERVFKNVIARVPHLEVMQDINRTSKVIYKNGLDFGFVTSYNAYVKCAIDHDNAILYIFKEYYNRGESDKELADALTPEKDEPITADSAEPKTIEFLRRLKFKIMSAKKGPGSVMGGIKKLKRFKKIVISDACPKASDEFSGLTFKTDKADNIIEGKFNIDPHTVNEKIA